VLHLASSLQGSAPNVPPAQMATAVFVFRQIICLLFILGWLIMFCFDTFFDTGEQLLPFWFNCIGMGVLAFSLGVNIESLTAFRGVSIAPIPQAQPQYTPAPAPPPQQPTRPYVPPEARQ
jgi:hypothetical protein